MSRVRINSGTTEFVTIELWNDFYYETTRGIREEYKNWLNEILKDDKDVGAIGGRLTFRITPTSLGVVVVVKDCVTKTEFNLTPYETW